MNSNDFQQELERRIDLYVNGRLNQEQIDALWVDMIQNPNSYEYLKTTVALREVFKKSSTPINATASNRKDTKKTKSRPTNNWKQYAAAAAIVVSAGVTGTYIVNSNSTQREISELKPFDKLELVVYRSSSSSQTLSDLKLELQKAIDFALLGNTSEALISLNSILEGTDDKLIKAEAYLNIGILEYNSNDFSSATMSLQNAASLSSDDLLLYERVIWNLAHAQMAFGDKAGAKNTIREVISLNGAHSRAAQSYLDFTK